MYWCVINLFPMLSTSELSILIYCQFLTSFLAERAMIFHDTRYTYITLASPLMLGGISAAECRRLARTRCDFARPADTLTCDVYAMGDGSPRFQRRHLCHDIGGRATPYYGAAVLAMKNERLSCCFICTPDESRGELSLGMMIDISL